MVEFQTGLNHASADRLPARNRLDLGFSAGYQYQYTRHFLIGASFFYQMIPLQRRNLAIQQGQNIRYYCERSSGNCRRYYFGIDGVGGVPIGDWMPYAKLGYGWTKALPGVGTAGGFRLGGGLAWHVSRRVILRLQYMSENFGAETGHLRYENLTLGVEALWGN